MTALALVAAIASGLQLDTSLTVTETLKPCKWVPSSKSWCYIWEATPTWTSEVCESSEESCKNKRETGCGFSGTSCPAPPEKKVI